MSMVIRDADGLLDISMTPPAPPLVATQQRCIILIKAADEKRVEIDLTNTVSPHFYSDAFLNEVSSCMFQTNSSLTVTNNNYRINRHRLTNIYISSWRKCALLQGPIQQWLAQEV